MFKSSIGTMIITMISRILGLLRGTLIAYYFGSSYVTDAYFSAFKISNFFRQLLGEGALGNTFIPLYNQKCEQEGEEKGRDYIFSVLNLVFLFSFVISVGTIFLSNPIIDFIVVGFPEETKNLASILLKIMSFYFLFISLSGMIGAVLNNFGEFLLPASTSIFFNLSIIFSAMFFSKNYGIYALAFGVLIGGIFQFFVVFFPLWKKIGRHSFRIQWKDKYLGLLAYRLLPMLVGIVARQVNTIVDQFFASFLAVGGVTALENASRVYLLPVGVFGVSLSNVVFPSLSKAAAKKDHTKIQRELERGFNILLFLVVPSMIVCVLYAKEVIRLLFSYGKFGENAVIITAEALLFYSLGLYAYVGVQFLSKGFYALGDNRRPARYSIMAIFINIALNALLIQKMEYRGLALATSIASCCNFFALWLHFHKKYISLAFLSCIKIAGISVLASFLAYGASRYFPYILLKFLVFSVIYLLCWAPLFYKKGREIF